VETIQPTELTGILQASISPVALISGVGLLLLSMTNRFGRTADRARLLAAQLRTAAPQERDYLDNQIRILYRRSGILRAAILLASASILFASLLAVALFLAFLVGTTIRDFAVLLFAMSFLGLIASVVLFIEDMRLALAALRLEVRGHIDGAP
jgi:Protein of unknown function (DUF2721)